MRAPDALLRAARHTCHQQATFTCMVCPPQCRLFSRLPGVLFPLPVLQDLALGPPLLSVTRGCGLFVPWAPTHRIAVFATALPFLPVSRCVTPTKLSLLVTSLPPPPPAVSLVDSPSPGMPGVAGALALFLLHLHHTRGHLSPHVFKCRLNASSPHIHISSPDTSPYFYTVDPFAYSPTESLTDFRG